MPKKPKVTTRDIAREAGLSQSTVSMILSGRKDAKFTAETIERVKNTADRLHYHYQKKDTKKENRSKDTILILCPSLSSQYYTTLIQVITEYAQKRQLHTLIAHTSRSMEIEEYYLHLAAESGFYGVIYTYPAKAIDLINRLSKKHSFVMINDYNPQLHVGFIEFDSQKSGKLMGRHLIELGHTHVAYMTTPLSKSELPRIRRLEGLQEAFTEAGFSAEHVQVYALTEEQWNNQLFGNRYYDAGYQLVMANQSLLKKDITAFVGTNDLVSIGIMDALKKLGYSIPKDYSVCGFDNTLASQFSGISLTTIDHCVDSKGKDAVDMLINQRKLLTLENADRKTPIMRLEYQPQLLIRSSTGKRRQE